MLWGELLNISPISPFLRGRCGAPFGHFSAPPLYPGLRGANLTFILFYSGGANLMPMRIGAAET